MSAPTQDIRDFLRYIIPHASACPDPVAEFLLRQAAIEFCERTKCWRQEATIAVDEQEEVPAAHTWAQIHQIERATFDGRDLTPVPYIDAHLPGLYGAQAENVPRYITQVNPGSVVIAPYKAGTLRLSMILKPQEGVSLGGTLGDPLKDAKNVVPPFLFDHHASAIADGALARILMLPEQPFTDPGKAALCQARFDAAIGEAASRFQRGQQNAPLRTRARWM